MASLCLYICCHHFLYIPIFCWRELLRLLCSCIKALAEAEGVTLFAQPLLLCFRWPSLHNRSWGSARNDLRFLPEQPEQPEQNGNNAAENGQNLAGNFLRSANLKMGTLGSS